MTHGLEWSSWEFPDGKRRSCVRAAGATAPATHPADCAEAGSHRLSALLAIQQIPAAETGASPPSMSGPAAARSGNSGTWDGYVVYWGNRWDVAWPPRSHSLQSDAYIIDHPAARLPPAAESRETADGTGPRRHERRGSGNRHREARGSLGEKSRGY